jgi:hypothetical protein
MSTWVSYGYNEGIERVLYEYHMGITQLSIGKRTRSSKLQLDS